MHRLFPLKIVIYLIGISFFVVWGAWGTLVGWQNLGLFDHLGFILKYCGFLAGLGVALSIPQVFGFLVGKFAKGSNLDLGGLYRIEMTSNWPAIKRLTEAANSTSSIFNVFDPEALPPTKAVTGFAILEVGLFGLKIRMKMNSTGNDSVSRGEDIRKDDARRAILRYVFVQTNAPHATASTDEPQHSGAAELVFDPKADKIGVFSGKYWTNRNYQKGMNTAGDIRLIRIERNKYNYPAEQMEVSL